MERAATLFRDGFTMSVLSRDNRGKDSENGKYEVDVVVWDQNGMVIGIPRNYDFEAIKNGTRICVVPAKRKSRPPVSFMGKLLRFPGKAFQ